MPYANNDSFYTFYQEHASTDDVIATVTLCIFTVENRLKQHLSSDT